MSDLVFLLVIGGFAAALVGLVGACVALEPRS